MGCFWRRLPFFSVFEGNSKRDLPAVARRFLISLEEFW